MWIHIEETHDQTYLLQRLNSVTKSPPLKKVKEHHPEHLKVDQSLILLKKDEEISELRSITKQLQEKQLTRQANDKSRGAVEAIAEVIEIIEEEIISSVPKPLIKTMPKIGNARLNKQVPTSGKISICSHRQELVLEDIPEFELNCHKCGKGFRHEANLLEHMKCPANRFCDCT